MTSVESITPYLEPVRKSVTVKRTAEEAFQIFTARIASWWPTAKYSVGQERTRDVVIEPGTGGRVYETLDDGETFDWGKVLAWEPPARFVMTWHPGRDPDVAQEVEVRFTAVEEGTRVDLEHRNWQGLGSEAAVVRGRYAGGWEEVLGIRYVAACS